LGVTQIPNPAYATTITIASQAALQVAIAHNWIVPNNLDMVPTSIETYFFNKSLLLLQTFLPPLMQ
jgi:hypothetical protein